MYHELTGVSSEFRMRVGGLNMCFSIVFAEYWHVSSMFVKCNYAKMLISKRICL